MQTSQYQVLVRSQCPCKPPPKQMLFSVLTRKGKGPILSFHFPRPRPWLRGGTACAGQLPCLSIHPVPGLGPFTRAWASLLGSPGEGSGALQDTALTLSLGPPPHLPVLRLEDLEGPGEKAVIHLSPHSAARTTVRLTAMEWDLWLRVEH